MSEVGISSNGQSVSQGLASKTFQIRRDDLLKIRVTAYDNEVDVNSRALVCQIEFFDVAGQFIENQAIDGVSVSAVYGSYVYIESIAEGQSAQWAKEVIVPPEDAHTLRLTLHPWKSSPQLRVLHEIECLDIRRATIQELISTIEPGVIQRKDYEILPFWRILYSFDMLKKNDMADTDCDVLVSFLDSDECVIDCQTASLKMIVGDIKGTDSIRMAVAIGPKIKACEYGGYQKVTACIQLTAPLNAVIMRVVIQDRNSKHPILVSQQICVFESLLESRLTVNSGALIGHCKSLPLELAQLSFVKLEEKFPNEMSVYEDSLNHSLQNGLIREMTACANQILNRFQNADLLSKARHALASVMELDPLWAPNAGKLTNHSNIDNAEGQTKKVAHLFRPTEAGSISYDASHAIEWMAKQMSQYSAFVISPLGYPSKGENGDMWEILEDGLLRHYHLNCISYEDLQTVPLTAQLNFMSILVKQILLEETASIIHAHEGVRGYDFALVGMALSKVLNLPLVYERRMSLGKELNHVPTTNNSLEAARLAQEYRCLKEAHAVILSVDALDESIQECEIEPGKIFLLPQLSPQESVSDTEIEMHTKQICEMYCRAYQYAWRSYRG